MRPCGGGGCGSQLGRNHGGVCVRVRARTPACFDVRYVQPRWRCYSSRGRVITADATSIKEAFKRKTAAGQNRQEELDKINKNSRFHLKLLFILLGRFELRILV